MLESDRLISFFVCMYIIYGLIQSKLRNKLGNGQADKLDIFVKITKSVYATKVHKNTKINSDKTSATEQSAEQAANHTRFC